MSPPYVSIADPSRSGCSVSVRLGARNRKLLPQQRCAHRDNRSNGAQKREIPPQIAPGRDFVTLTGPDFVGPSWLGGGGGI